MQAGEILGKVLVMVLVTFALLVLFSFGKTVLSFDKYMERDIELKEMSLQVQAMQLIAIACQGERGSLVGDSVRCEE